VPNKSTREARAAIAAFVDDNAGRLQEWLDKVANGVPRTDRRGQPVENEDTGEVAWLLPPNPEKAFNMVQSVIEYHVPKLARREITGPNGGPIGLAALNLNGLSDAELETAMRLLTKASAAEAGE
jgi:hypothetical protein